MVIYRVMLLIDFYLGNFFCAAAVFNFTFILSYSQKRCVSYALVALAAGGLILFVLNHEPAGLGWAVPVLLLLGSAYLLKEHY